MEYKIINTGDYLLIVDDSDIKEGDWFYLNDANIIAEYISVKPVNEAKKIIVHLPLNNSPILDSVDFLPPLEDEVEKLAKEQLQSIEKVVFITSTKEEEYLFCDGFEIGYNKAKEKYKYTEEDMKKAMLKYGEWIMSNLSSKEYIKDSNNQTVYEHIIKSFQQPKMPVGFNRKFIENKLWGQKGTRVYITETNSQGLTQLVGEYIY